MVTAELKAQGGSLNLKTDDQGWCRLYFIDPSVEYLGAESYAILQEKLCKTLRNRDSLEVFGQIEGTNVAWVLGLGDKHSSLYASRKGDLLTLYVQDAKARVIARLELTEEDCKAWLEQLCADRNASRGPGHSGGGDGMTDKNITTITRDPPAGACPACRALPGEVGCWNAAYAPTPNLDGQAIIQGHGSLEYVRDVTGGPEGVASLLRCRQCGTEWVLMEWYAVGGLDLWREL